MRFAEEDVLAWLSIKIIEYGTKEDAQLLLLFFFVRWMKGTTNCLTLVSTWHLHCYTIRNKSGRSEYKNEIEKRNKDILYDFLFRTLTTTSISVFRQSVCLQHFSYFNTTTLRAAYCSVRARMNCRSRNTKVTGAIFGSYISCPASSSSSFSF